MRASSDNVDTKKLPNEGDHAGEAKVRKDGFRAGGGECDPSTMCTDEDRKFVARLQVPGNGLGDKKKRKGKGGGKEIICLPFAGVLVKVSVRDGGTGNVIVLKEGSSNCSLDFKDLIALNSVNDSDESAKSYISFISRSPDTVTVFLAALLMLASGWMCFSVQKRHLLNSHSRYQKLDTGLPVLARAKTEDDVNDGWDNSWDDSWNDEEAPHTPPMPVIPSLSSKGLASRRLNKEGWKH
ncbi:hypothetical protein SLEP1_g40399 [Rubroshorea leprosula]|uniref:Uncharacterized protein n=1 Tax=Rubroshorea leprosula TaxID=152421 RepID=A0AAV5L3N3_9ROSI|nr:hypothetical protein SLEP1_g40399 [Rubroshorea leprosula]